MNSTHNVALPVANEYGTSGPDAVFRKAESVLPATVLQRLGIIIAKGGWFPCPSCNEREPSATFQDDAGDYIRRWRCTGCEENGSVVDLVAQFRKLNDTNAARWILGLPTGQEDDRHADISDVGDFYASTKQDNAVENEVPAFAGNETRAEIEVMSQYSPSGADGPRASIDAGKALFQRAKAVPLSDVLERLGIHFEGHKFLCQFHDDHNPSADFRDKLTGKEHSHWKCFACKAKGSGIDLVVKKMGIEPIEAARWILRESTHAANGHATTPKPRESAKGRQQKVHKTEDDAIGALLYSVRKNRGKDWQAVGEWHPYQDTSGKVVLGVVRFEDGNGNKEFRQFSRQGNGWITRSLTSGIPPLNLPVLDKAKPLVIVEGEKACAAAWEIGLQATTWAGGANAVHKTDWSLLAGFDVVIWPDADEPGRKAATDVGKALHGVAARVRILPDDPNAGEGDDAADVLAEKGQENALDHFGNRLDRAIDWTQTESDDVGPNELRPKAEYNGRRYYDPQIIAERFLNANSSPVVVVKGVPYLYDSGVYRPVANTDLTAELTRFTVNFFERHHMAEIALFGKEGYEPPIRQVTKSIIDNVRLAVDGLCTESRVTTFPEWRNRQPDDWPANRVIHCANGLLNADTLEFYEGHNPRWLSLCKSEASWQGPDAPYPRFLQWLMEVMPGSDAEAEKGRETMQMWFGYLLVSDRSHHKMLNLVGERRTGKGTTLRLMQRLIGRNNVCHTSLTEISGRFGLEPLLGKTVAMIGDARPGKANTDLSTGAERMLAITGGDSLGVDRKGIASLPSVDLPIRFVMASNGHFNMPDPNGVLPTRLVTLRFDQSFAGRENSQVEAELVEELPGILAWAVRGLRRLTELGGFYDLESTREACEISQEIAQPLLAFMNTVFTDERGDSVDFDEAFDAYIGWLARYKPSARAMNKGQFRNEIGSCRTGVKVIRPKPAGGGPRPYKLFGVTPNDLFEGYSRDGKTIIDRSIGVPSHGYRDRF